MLQEQSPFHAELFAMLQKDAGQGNAFGLDSIRLERKLLDAFSPRETKEHFLRIYRGLPRLYRLDRPAEFRIKNHFADLAQLKKLAAEKSVFGLYEGCPLPQMAKVSLLTWVRSDGWSDYVAGFEAIEILKEKYPELELSWIVFASAHLGSPKVPQGAKTHLVLQERSQEPLHLEQEVLELLRTSDVVLQIPTVFPGFAALRAAVASIPFNKPEPSWLSLREYGLLELSQFSPKTSNRSMGLHFLEKGILTRTNARINASFSNLQNMELMQWLFASVSPTDEEIAKYRLDRHFYFADLTSAVGGAVYLHTLIKAHEKDEKGIDLCVPDLGWVIRYIDLQNRQSRPVLEMDDVGLEIYFQGKVTPLAKGKKMIRIFSPSGLSPSDLQLLILLSGSFVGLKDDQEFSEAVSSCNGFFYDGKESSRYFLKDLSALAENRLKKYQNTLKVLRSLNQVALYQLPKDGGEWVEETHFQERLPWKEIALNAGEALQNMDADTGFQQLTQIISHECSCNAFLCSWIKRALCHRAHPHLLWFEEESLDRFARGGCSIQELISTFKEELGFLVEN